MSWQSIVTCDRCGARQELPLEGWGRVELPRYPSKTAYDFCPSCFDFIQSILKGKDK